MIDSFRKELWRDMHRGVFRTAALLLLLACRSAETSPYAGTPVIRDDTLWQFPSGATAATYLRTEVKFIGLLTDTTGDAYILASGVECDHCDADLSVLLQPAGEVAR